jgi:apolipoprotein N-acyltransferase
LDNRENTSRQRHTARIVALLACSGILLTLIQPPFGMAWLAWVAYVPFVLACSPAVHLRTLACAAYGVGFLYWLASLYWITPITVLGWIAFCLYMAVLWPLMAVAFRYGRSKKVPLPLLTAVVVTGTEALQGFPLGGFLWRFLGHSQFQNPAIIQITDVFGAAGVSFLVAMASGLAGDLILATCDRNLFRVRHLVQGIGVATAVAAAVFYGRWRLAEAASAVTGGPLVGSVQSNVPQSVKRTFQASQGMFADLMQMSKASQEAGAELIVWPETTVQAHLDREIWPWFKEDPVEYRQFDKDLREHAKAGSSLLVGAYGGRIRQDPEGETVLDRYNSAFFYKPDGTQDPNRYDKIHLVLFGEYLPFKHSFHWLYSLLMKFTPYNYEYTLEPGKDHTVFTMNARAAARETVPCRLGVLICYEDTVPALARQFTVDPQGHKRLDALLNISNDGWFVRFSGSPARVQPSAELAQHVAVCTFRAVENRVPILRSVNTGISCLIDSCGRIHDGFVKASEGIPERALDRTGMAGWFVDRMPIDKRVSLFSRYGRWLDALCAVLVVAGLVLAALEHRRGHERRR